jgi:hypothetical protein
LAERLQADFPHLQIEHRACDLHHLLWVEHDLLAAANLIVAATGSWAAESALNRWHLDQRRTRPILYGWTEAHACAGHGVAIAKEGGCPTMPDRPNGSAVVQGCGMSLTVESGTPRTQHHRSCAPWKMPRKTIRFSPTNSYTMMEGSWARSNCAAVNSDTSS